MPSGGARARSGPPPDPDALRRNRPSAQAQIRYLDPDGRRGLDAPEWPAVVGEPTDAELLMWEEEWQRPQAVVWLEDHQELTVAMYVRMFLDAFRTGGPVTARDKVRILMDALFITSDGLLRGGFRIGPAVEQVQVSADAVSRAADRGWSVVKGGG